MENTLTWKNFLLLIVPIAIVIALGAMFQQWCPGEQVVLVTFESEPPGASVWLAGERLSGVTPIRNHPLSSRSSIQVRMVKEGYREREATYLIEDLLANPVIHWALEAVSPTPMPTAAPTEQPVVTTPAPDSPTEPPVAPPETLASIVTAPSGARVRINGVTLGSTSPVKVEIPDGVSSFQIEVSKHGYFPERRTLGRAEILRDRGVRIKLRRRPSPSPTPMPSGSTPTPPRHVHSPTAMPPLAEESSPPPTSPPVKQVVMLVLTDPDGALVTVDGEVWGRTPVKARRIPKVGEVTITIEKEGYDRQENLLNLENIKGDTNVFKVNLVESVVRGSLTVLTKPVGAEVRVDAKVVERKTPFSDMTLRARGPISVSIRLDGYTPVEKTVSLEQLERGAVIDVVLEPRVLRPDQCAGDDGAEWLERLPGETRTFDELDTLRRCFAAQKNWSAVTTVSTRLIDDEKWGKDNRISVIYYARARARFEYGQSVDDYRRCLDDVTTATRYGGLSQCQQWRALALRIGCVQYYQRRVGYGAQTSGVPNADELIIQLENKLENVEPAFLTNEELECVKDVKKELTALSGR